MCKTFLLHNSPFERVILSNGGSSPAVSQGLPEDLRAAYKGIKTLCDAMDTRLSIHSYARELYDAALERFFEFKATKAFVGDGYEAIDQAAVGKAKGRNATVKEDENANNADSFVDDSIKPLLAAYKRIDTFRKCLPLPLPVSCHVTAHSTFLYKKVHLSGGSEEDEQAAVLAGCFYFAFRRPEVPCTFREVWVVTRVPIAELEAVVKDLENFFAEARLETHSRKEARRLPCELDTVSTLDTTHSMCDTEAEGLANVLSNTPMPVAMKPTTLPPTTVTGPDSLPPAFTFTFTAGVH